jgi:putative solute:sodium symporter small subunit
MDHAVRRLAAPYRPLAGRQVSKPYWRKTRAMTAVLLLLWCVVCVASCVYADQLNAYVLFGFPLGFYLVAQGSLIVFLLIIVFYAWYMNRLDRQYSIKGRGGAQAASDTD